MHAFLQIFIVLVLVHIIIKKTGRKRKSVWIKRYKQLDRLDHRKYFPRQGKENHGGFVSM